MANVNERLRDVGFVELRSPGDGEFWQLSAQGVDQDGTCLGRSNCDADQKIKRDPSLHHASIRSRMLACRHREGWNNGWAERTRPRREFVCTCLKPKWDKSPRLVRFF